MTFPQYRKHRSGKNFYIIIDETHFTEIQCIGAQNKMFQIEAKTYFEKIQIQDMLDLKEPYIKADEMDINVIKNR